MKKLIVLAVLALATAMLFAAFDPKESYRLFYVENDYEADFAYLEKCLASATSDSEKAEILWRMSRTRLTLTDENKDKLSEAERYAGYGDYGANDKPKANDTTSAYYYAYTSLQYKETADGYHWESSAVGRAGQEHGALNSLKKADPMRKLEVKALEDFGNFELETDAWYVLGVLYNLLPGKPISFGNNDYAISYMRKCLDTMDSVRSNGSNYLELAEQLWARNWDAKKRGKEFSSMLSSYNKNLSKGVVEACKYYEGYVSSQGNPFYLTSPITSISDRDEAKALVNYAIKDIEKRLASAPALAKEKMGEEKAKLEEALKSWS